MKLRDIGAARMLAARDVEDRRFAALIGQRLARVRYFELDYRRDDQPEVGSGPAWPGPEFHSIDHGVQFELESGLQWGITWQAPGEHGESLIARAGLDLTQILIGPRVWDATDLAPWSSLIGLPIVGARIVWDHWSAQDLGESRFIDELWCQRTLVVSFGEAGEILIALGERRLGQDQMTYQADNLALFWNREIARRHGVMLESD